MEKTEKWISKLASDYLFCSKYEIKTFKTKMKLKKYLDKNPYYRWIEEDKKGWHVCKLKGKQTRH